jgi:hypothetical protein
MFIALRPLLYKRVVLLAMVIALKLLTSNGIII